MLKIYLLRMLFILVLPFKKILDNYFLELDKNFNKLQNVRMG